MKIRIKVSRKPFLHLFSLLALLLIALPVGAEEEEPSQGATSSAETSVSSMTSSGATASVPEVSSPAVGPEISVYSGAATYNIPIVVTPGRAGIGPNLFLRYNSYHKNGWTGVGWSLDVGAIERCTKRGVDYDANDFLSVMNGSSTELVPRDDWGSDYYGAKIEEAFSKYCFKGEEGWEVTTKDGTKYYYGSTSDSRQDNEHGVFKWCLDRVENTNGNYMTVSYTKDQGQIYLDRIDYTGNESLGPTNYVKFYLESRTDPPVMYTTNSKVVTAYRLRTIDVQARGSRVRAYKLTFTASGNTSRSLLLSVQQYGSDAALDATGTVTGGTALPAMTLVWPAEADGTFGSIAETPIDWGRGWHNYARLADVNGDGKSDLVYTGSTKIWVKLSNGDGTFGSIAETPIDWGSGWHDYARLADVNGDGKSDWVYTGSTKIWVKLSNGDGTFGSIAETPIESGKGWHDYARLADVNGDGKSDWVYTGSTMIWVKLSNGDGTFGSIAETPIEGGWGWHDYARLADVNGDGKSDWVYPGNKIWVKLSNGDGTFGSIAETPIDWGSGWHDYARLADVNGDGKSDLVYTGSTKIWVKLSNGDGTFGSIAETPIESGKGWHDYARLADVNGDGRSDWVYPGSTMIWVKLSNGDGTFGSIAETPIEGGWGWHDYARLADVNGDGKSDWVYTGNKIWVKLSNGRIVLPDSISNSLGATTTIEYTPSSQYQNTLLPFILHTVSSVTTDDGLGNQATTNYTYSGGLYDYADMEFRGFEYVKQTNPDGTTVETRFHQDQYLKGRPYEVEAREAGETGARVSRTTMTWEKIYLDDPENTCAFVKMAQKHTGFYGNDVETAFTLEEFTYDVDVQEDPLTIAGNLISTEISGTDAETVTTTFQYDTFGDWLWRKTRDTVEGSTSGKVRESYYSYEYSTGNLVTKESWLDGAANPIIEITYDSYGNQISITDARGNTTSTGYDEATHTYPVKTTYPQTGGVSHIVENEEYDYRFGKVTTKKDENGNRTYYTYDIFGRLILVDYPDGGQVETEYHDEVFPGYVVTRVKEDASGNSVDKYVYFDGLGRTIQSITFGEDNNSIVTKTHYDEMGRNYLVEGPFFSTGAGYPKSPPTEYPWVQTEYDNRGRPKKVTRPDDEYGTVATTFSYDGLSTTVTDPDNKQKTKKKDYLGRIMQVSEHADEGAQYHTHYAYNAAGDLISVTDHLGNITSMSYDTLGRKVTMDDPDMGHWTYAYDSNGNLITQTDEKGQTITLSYDELNRKTSKTYSTSEPTVVNTTPSRLAQVGALGYDPVHVRLPPDSKARRHIRSCKIRRACANRIGMIYTYDDLSIPNGRGRLYSVFNRHVTTTYGGYDQMGRVESVTKEITGEAACTTSYKYDLSGRRTRITYPDGYDVDYSYYPGTGLLDSVAGPDGEQFAKHTLYEPTGKIGQVDYGNNTTTMYTYDPLSTRLTGIVTFSGSGDIQRRYYSYSQAQDIIAITDDLEGITYSYTYDDLHRLVGETNTGSYDPVSYEYNPIGNIMSKTVGTNTFTYSYDSAHKHAVKTVTLAGADYPYTYDKNGNMTAGPNFTDKDEVVTRNISYNANNMPVKIKNSGTITKFVYDGKGARAKKVVDGSTTYYTGKHFEITDGVATKYIFAGNTRAAKIKGSDVYYYHKDHLGSSTVITDENGVEVEATEYMPFGGQRDHTGLAVTNYKYTDQELDPSTGLYNYRARLYDPVIGRFISPDTIVPNPSDPQMLNRYSYCRNNPLIYVDPSGHSIWDVFNSRMSRGRGRNVIRGIRTPLGFLPGVNVYSARNGCTPASVGMIMDYHRNTGGLSNLMGANPAVSSAAAQFSVASMEHRGEVFQQRVSSDSLHYLNRFNSELRGAHNPNCVADFMKTSFLGGTLPKDVAEGISNWAQSRGYTASVVELSDLDGSLKWDALTGEMDAGRPVLLQVDVQTVFGDIGHSVVMVGYEDRDGQTSFLYVDPRLYPINVVLSSERGLVTAPYRAWLIDVDG